MVQLGMHSLSCCCCFSSSSSSIMADVDSKAPRSLYIVVLRAGYTSPWFCSILQFKSEEENKSKMAADLIQHCSACSSSGNHLLQKEYIAHFRLLQRPASIAWQFSPLNSTQELCMVPYVLSTYEQINHHLPSLHAFTFNFATNTCTKISPCTIPSKPNRCVVSLVGYMYFMPQPYDFRYLPEQRFFERYNPAENSWETLKPFPLPRDENDTQLLQNICGTAVLDDSDTILFNIGDIWAYNVKNDSWYLVMVEDSLCYSFVGEAVVQENTIYALKDKSFESVLALSITIVMEESNDGEPVYTCSLLSEISLPDINHTMLSDVAFSSMHLVHLGNDNFCVVRSFVLEGLPDYQPIYLTYMKLTGTNSLIVTDNKVHKLRLEGSKQFRVGFCFSMPDCKTPPAVKHGKNIFFDMDPFRVGFDINEIYQKHGNTYFNSETGQFVMPPLPISPLVAKDEDDVSSQTNMIDEASTISSPTDVDFPVSPTFQTVGEEVEYYTRGMPRGEAFKARSMLLERLRQERCGEFSSSLANNPPFPET